MKTVAVYGGSFDPFHIGHAFLIQYILLTGQADMVILMPVYQHVTKARILTSFEHRFEMCRLGIQSYVPKVLVSMLERELGGASKTIRTMRGLRNRQPLLKWRFACGSDVFNDRESWGGTWEKLEKEFNPIVVGRWGAPGTEPAVIPSISSTEIRNMIREGKDVSGLVPKGTLAYIKEHKLYMP